MRYKALLAVAILLIGVSLYSQTVSPVTIETLDTTPTVVRTGQVFVQGYRIRYLDLSKYGEKVIIYEDKIKTGFLTLPDEIEIVEFNDGKNSEEKVGNETSKDISFVLKIIGPEKGSYKIPKGKLEWSIQRAGQTEENAENQKPIETEKEVYINYTTTITSDPYLDIRDKVYLAIHQYLTWTFWLISRALSPLAVLLLLVIFSVYMLRGKSAAEKEPDTAKPEEFDEPEASELPISFTGAYRLFFKELNRLEKNFLFSRAGMDKNKTLGFKRELSVLVRNLIGASLGDLNPGDSAWIILNQTRNVKGLYGQALSALALMLADYEKAMVSDSCAAYGDDGFNGELEFLKTNARLADSRLP